MSDLSVKGSLTRKSKFSYTCNQCSRCCYDKQVQVNPYEVARLARSQGVSTTDLIDTCLDPGKPYLKNQPDGACIFLTNQKCQVHADRPLVCRLYPLGQKRTGKGEESFHYATPDPQTKGMYGQDGIIDDFLKIQGIALFLDARDRYVSTLYRLLDVLAKEVQDNEQAFTTTAETFDDDASIQDALTEWLDMDTVISHYCHTYELEEPENLEARLEIHLQAMELWITNHCNRRLL